MTAPTDLTDKVAIVTGSTRGIGRAIAETLADAGARVVISSRTADACTATARQLQERGLHATPVPCHVGVRDQVEHLVETVRETHGAIDVLVCNAATNPVAGSMSEVTDDAFDKILRTNVRSVMWLCDLVLPAMAERGSGSIIVVASTAALFGNRMIGVYGMSKAANTQLVRNLATEWGHRGIRANAIAPGLIQTDFAEALWANEKIRRSVEAGTPLGRIGQPQDVAGVALFLASEAGRFVTGQTIVVDGGRSVADVM